MFDMKVDFGAVWSDFWEDVERRRPRDGPGVVDVSVGGF